MAKGKRTSLQAHPQETEALSLADSQSTLLHHEPMKFCPFLPSEMASRAIPWPSAVKCAKDGRHGFSHFEQPKPSCSQLATTAVLPSTRLRAEAIFELSKFGKQE